MIDESSAIQWLRQQIVKKPQTFQELHPQFLKEIGGWQKHEKPLELSELLEQNFLRYDGNGEVPSQIHSYLSTNFKELRKLPKDDVNLRAKAKDRWYVPDPNKAGDLEKLRERSLLKEFEDYLTSTQKRLKVFRLEAVRAGFKKAWQERDYATIITVAARSPKTSSRKTRSCSCGTTRHSRAREGSRDDDPRRNYQCMRMTAFFRNGLIVFGPGKSHCRDFSALWPGDTQRFRVS